MRARSVRSHNSAGFSLIEMIIVLSLATTISALALGVLGTASAVVQGDADLRLVEAQLRLARESAINQRRAMQVQFVLPNLINIVRVNLPAGTQLLTTTALEHHAQFMLFGGMPDTPDGFGNPDAIAFGGAANMFTADGMLTDANGNPINGTVFLGQLNRPLTARAITVFGPTATVRTYRWNGSAWRR